MRETLYLSTCADSNTHNITNKKFSPPPKKKGGGAERTFYLFRRHETLNLSMVLIKASIQKNQERGGDLLYLGTMEEDL